MDYKIWNKQDAINGVSAERILSYRTDICNAIENNDDVILIGEGVNVREIVFRSFLVSNYNLNSNLTTEQVVQAYLDIKALEEEKAKQDQITLEQQVAKINTLESSQANTEYLLMMGGLV